VSAPDAFSIGVLVGVLAGLCVVGLWQAYAERCAERREASVRAEMRELIAEVQRHASE
jgi:hypothetical protein